LGSRSTGISLLLWRILWFSSFLIWVHIGLGLVFRFSVCGLFWICPTWFL
jgi:hypothetical protein